MNKRAGVRDGVLTYKIEDGGCDTSFGINVAKLARFPVEVSDQAEKYLEDL